MKVFRPDQTQVSMFRFWGIHQCRICFQNCGTSRLIAQPGCCECIVHLDCFNDLAAHPISASIFLCPNCDRELSGESVRAVRRRTSLGKKKGSKQEQVHEMMLGRVATKNITPSRRRLHRPACGSDGDVRHPQELSQPSSESLEITKHSDSAPETGAEEVSDPRRRLGRNSQTLTFLPPSAQMAGITAAERNKTSWSGNLLCGLLVMIAGRRKRGDIPPKRLQERQRQIVDSRILTMICGQPAKQTVPRPPQEPQDEWVEPVSASVEMVEQHLIFVYESW